MVGEGLSKEGGVREGIINEMLYVGMARICQDPLANGQGIWVDDFSDTISHILPCHRMW